MLGFRLLVAAAVVLLGAAYHADGAPAPAAPSAAQLRVDQVGYLTGSDKLAILMAPRPLANPTVRVVDAAGNVAATATVTARARWSNAFPNVYGVEFTSLTRAGRYHLELAGAAVRSPDFALTTANALWTRTLQYGLRFDQLQRDGATVVGSVLRRQPSHLNDRSANVYAHPHFQPDSDVVTDRDLTQIGGPVDVEGGWFDAGDYLKFTHSTAYADILLFTAARDLGAAAPATVLREARYGLGWLSKMWDRTSQTLYLQVGIGSGNEDGTFLGDHDGWRLPQDDDADTAHLDRYVAHRPVFLAAAPGAPLSPNLAGRVSAAFALAAQADATASPARAARELDQATSLYAMAKTTAPGRLVTALPFAFYPESAWRDDMELGAVEIARAARALGRPSARYLVDAGKWARGYVNVETGDTFNLYDVSALAHADLVRTMGSASLAVTKAQVIADLRRQLVGARNRSANDPFAAGVDDTEFDVDSHTLGLVATEGWYASVSGDDSFATLAARLRGWVFGRNEWGVSFLVGVGSSFPHCMQHQVANLVGRTDGTAPLALGAVVNGPNGADQFAGGLGGFQDGTVHCPSTGSPPAAPPGAYDGSGSVYRDDVRAWQTNEPALDMTGAAIIAAAAQLAP